MENKNRWDSEGCYHDDNIRLNNYFESADIKLERTDLAQTDFNAHIDVIEKVVQSVQMELGWEISKNPNISAKEIKIAGLDRLIDLKRSELITKEELEKCYKRFAYLVDYYFGT